MNKNGPMLISKHPLLWCSHDARPSVNYDILFNYLLPSCLTMCYWRPIVSTFLLVRRNVIKHKPHCSSLSKGNDVVPPHTLLLMNFVIQDVLFSCAVNLSCFYTSTFSHLTSWFFCSPSFFFLPSSCSFSPFLPSPAGCSIPLFCQRWQASHTSQSQALLFLWKVKAGIEVKGCWYFS